MYDRSPLLPSLTACVGKSLIIGFFFSPLREGLLGGVVVNGKEQSMTFKKCIQRFSCYRSFKSSSLGGCQGTKCRLRLSV